jgi:hypothetical protein
VPRFASNRASVVSRRIRAHRSKISDQVVSQVAVIVDARLKGGSITESCRGAHMSGGLSHCRPLIIVDQVPPEAIRAAAQDIACRASKVHVLAVGTCAIN